MKKLLFYFVAIVNCILFSSCSDMFGCGVERDMTLAGSITSGSTEYPFIATGEYDGSPLGEYSDSYGPVFNKISDTNISMNCHTRWGETEMIIDIIIPSIPLNGEPDNVTFDFTSANATVSYDGIEYSPVEMSVKGGIRNVDFIPDATRCSPAIYEFLCEIDMECLLDGKKLKLNLTPPDNPI